MPTGGPGSFGLSTWVNPSFLFHVRQPPVAYNERLNIALFIVSVPILELEICLNKRVNFWPTKLLYNLVHAIELNSVSSELLSARF